MAQTTRAVRDVGSRAQRVPSGTWRLTFRVWWRRRWANVQPMKCRVLWPCRREAESWRGAAICLPGPCRSWEAAVSTPIARRRRGEAGCESGGHDSR